jgi:hypothetical protein
MNDGQAGTGKQIDPFESLRKMRDSYLDAMAKVMVNAVNTESYAQATGAMLDTYLTASAPFREALEASMVHALEQLSLPSRQELAVLAERFTNLEMRLDDIDAKLDEVVRSIRSTVRHAPSEPVQTQAARPGAPATKHVDEGAFKRKSPRGGSTGKSQR